MSWLAIGYAAGALICLILGWLGFRYGKGKIAFHYSFLCVATFYWQMCTTMVLTSTNESQALLWSKLAYLGVLFIPSALFEIMIEVLNVQKTKWLRLGMHSSTFVLLALFLYSDWLLEGTNVFEWGYWYKASRGHELFALLFTFVILVIPIKMLSLSKKSPENSKLISGIAKASLIGNLAAIDFLPDYGINVYPIGFIFVTVSFLALSKVLWQSNAMLNH